MILQHYKVKITQDHYGTAKPGQFVKNELGNILGFIDFVSDEYLAIMLFDSREIDPKEIPGLIPISEKCDYMERLDEILGSDVEMLHMWTDACFPEDDVVVYHEPELERPKYLN